jgi:hypothetical protein
MEYRAQQHERERTQASGLTITDMARTSRKLLVVNASAVIGCAIGLFLVPRSTTIATYLLCCAVAVVVMNIAVMVPRDTDPNAPANNKFQTIVWIILVVVVVVLEMILNRHGRLW